MPRRSKIKFICRMVLGVLVSLFISPQRTVSGSFQGIEGNFCRHRKPSECCDDRLDSCEVPIMDSFCYCDEFCLSGDRINNDCCPDFFQVCLGHKNSSKTIQHPPQDDPGPLTDGRCEFGGWTLRSGETRMVNCNKCQCQMGAQGCEDDYCMINEKLMSEINESPSRFGWTAGSYDQFWGRKARDGLRLKTGTFSPADSSQEMYPIRLEPDVSKIPESFDARKKVEWAGRVGDICDQGWCGASWVFSTLGVAQDRLSILARGLERVELSAQDILSCAKLGQEDCQGGHIDRAWNYLRRVGTVKEECYKYNSGQSGKVGRCLRQRLDPSHLTCQDRFKMQPAYRISGREEDIQWEIMHNGPVQALMTVHRDFFMYKSGVYCYSQLTNSLVGGPIDRALHSVRIIGWGISRTSRFPVKYWLVANSWGTEWGERGYFQIKRGTNECGIESFILASRAKLANLVYGKRNGN